MQSLVTLGDRAWSPLLRALALAAIGVVVVTPLANHGERPTAQVDTPEVAVPAVAAGHQTGARPGLPAAEGGAVPAVPTAPRARHGAKRPSAPARPAKAAPVAAGVRPAAAGRWLPTGAGMWTHIWKKTEGGNGRKVVHRALLAGVSTIYVRTGSSHDGFNGGPALRSLLPAVRGTGVRVVAWDFPTLAHPKADARRLARAAWFWRGSGSAVSAVAPDIETRAEGTHLSTRRVQVYLETLRRLLPADVAILGTVPWPSRYRVGKYPYATVARYADALLPMAYWYNNSPTTVTAKSVGYLRRFNRPVMPVGQGYDSRLDVPSLPRSNQSHEVAMFMYAARDAKAPAVSLWSWQTAGPHQWRALKWASQHIDH